MCRSPHDHAHSHESPEGTAAFADLSVPERELSPSDVSRRRFLLNSGLLGAAAVGVTALGGLAAARPASAATRGSRTYAWLAGDHHVHTQYSYDGMYTIEQQAAGAIKHGRVDWLVITDHGHAAHEKFAVESTYADIVASRARHPRLLLWQGLEWNVPGGEHATVFFDGARDEVQLLRSFERLFDSRINGTGAGTPENEAKALEALGWLDTALRTGSANSALFLLNHVMRRGRYSPREIRAYRDAAPHIAVGMEGAPGAQNEPRARGDFNNTPDPASWPGWRPEHYPTYGGFDSMTGILGGMWDSMLAEGKGWWITTNSDGHFYNNDTIIEPERPGDWYDLHGKYPDPIDGGVPLRHADFWPGQFSRTVVGATSRSYGAVMEAIKSGRVWVSMGGLIDNLYVDAHAPGNAPATLGGRLSVRRGDDVTVTISVRLAGRPNANDDVPKLARLDLIRGAITGPAADPDTFTAPDVSVVESFTPKGNGRVAHFHYKFRDVREPFYFRLRGTDGKRSAAGGLEPAADTGRNENPWNDLWFYANPIFVGVS
ncbi:PHP domain-containing protein [Nonomuraea lactucae]|uniref:PHP domain-containing protein n=1 Tax=Nonomuraea lactucae TaxID=2249762 RepID=UPI001962BE35|nr:PHP domain-containing protein [Nonomuraea lactucae]